MESSLSNALRHVCKEAHNVAGRSVMRQRYDHGSTQNSAFCVSQTVRHGVECGEEPRVADVHSDGREHSANVRVGHVCS
jgi:hypothetical protein